MQDHFRRGHGVPLAYPASMHPEPVGQGVAQLGEVSELASPGNAQNQAVCGRRRGGSVTVVDGVDGMLTLAARHHCQAQ